MVDRLARGVLSPVRRRAVFWFVGAMLALSGAGGVWAAQRAAAYPELEPPALALAALLLAEPLPGRGRSFGGTAGPQAP